MDIPVTAWSGFRVFRTRWFAKAAGKALISDTELCEAVSEVMQGQCDDLGGGVFKKRLNRNMHRSIILAKGKRNWIYAYLFAKQDRANVDPGELAAFCKLANLDEKNRLYEEKTPAAFEMEMQAGELLEICRGDEAQIQE